MADTFYEFNEDAVQGALDAARENSRDEATAKADARMDLTRKGEMSVLAECIDVRIENGKVCLSLPLGLGRHCINIPVKFDSDVAKACLSICTTWGIPTGVKVSVIVAGITVVSQSFGKC